MIILLTVLMVLIFVLGIWMANKLYDKDACFTVGMTMAVISAIGVFVCLITLIVLSVNVSGLNVIDQKIEMYEEENTKIEEQISDMVKQYQEYESDIFTEISPESSVVLVSLYPDLKSDALVQKQIEVYLDNNDKIKELKADKINGSVQRWWLYFGG